MTDLRDMTLALGAATLSLATTQVEAQGARQCAERAAVVQRLADVYGETRQAIGLGGDSAVIEVFASHDSGSWTITVTLVNGMTCLLASGEAYEALVETLPGKGNDA